MISMEGRRSYSNLVCLLLLAACLTCRIAGSDSDSIDSTSGDGDFPIVRQRQPPAAAVPEEEELAGQGEDATQSTEEVPDVEETRGELTSQTSQPQDSQSPVVAVGKDGNHLPRETDEDEERRSLLGKPANDAGGPRPPSPTEPVVEGLPSSTRVEILDENMELGNGKESSTSTDVAVGDADLGDSPRSQGKEREDETGKSDKEEEGRAADNGAQSDSLKDTVKNTDTKTPNANASPSSAAAAGAWFIVVGVVVSSFFISGTTVGSDADDSSSPTSSSYFGSRSNNFGDFREYYTKPREVQSKASPLHLVT